MGAQSSLLAVEFLSPMLVICVWLIPPCSLSSLGASPWVWRSQKTSRLPQIPPPQTSVYSAMWCTTLYCHHQHQVTTCSLQLNSDYSLCLSSKTHQAFGHFHWRRWQLPDLCFLQWLLCRCNCVQVLPNWIMHCGVWPLQWLPTCLWCLQHNRQWVLCQTLCWQWLCKHC